MSPAPRFYKYLCAGVCHCSQAVFTLSFSLLHSSLPVVVPPPFSLIVSHAHSVVHVAVMFPPPSRFAPADRLAVCTQLCVLRPAFFAPDVRRSSGGRASLLLAPLSRVTSLPSSYLIGRSRVTAVAHWRGRAPSPRSLD